MEWVKRLFHDFRLGSNYPPVYEMTDLVVLV